MDTNDKGLILPIIPTNFKENYTLEQKNATVINFKRIIPMYPFSIDYIFNYSLINPSSFFNIDILSDKGRTYGTIHLKDNDHFMID
jgi:hypothetical protein